MSTKKQIKASWDEIGKKYMGYRRKPWPFLQKFLDKVDDDLLDIGAGNCGNTKEVLERGINLYAVDFSEEMLKLAPNEVNKIIADVTKIPLKRKFKYITAISVLHHLPNEKDRIKFFKEIKRLLDKDGIALITSWDLRQRGHVIRLWGKIKRDYYILDKSEIEELLKKVNITNYIITRKKTISKGYTTPYNYFIKITQN